MPPTGALGPPVHFSTSAVYQRLRNPFRDRGGRAVQRATANRFFETITTCSLREYSQATFTVADQMHFLENVRITGEQFQVVPLNVVENLRIDR